MNIAGDVLRPVVSDLLEAMYFMEPVYLGEAPPPPGAYRVAVGFTGSVSGEFRLSVTPELARHMAADFLADEAESIDPQQIDATIRELANVACCASIAAWWPDADFQFTVPFLPTDEGTAPPSGHAFSVLTGKPEISFEVLLSESITPQGGAFSTPERASSLPE